MKSRRFDIASLAINGSPFPLREASLVAIARDDQSVDWEVIVHAIATDDIEVGVHHLTLRAFDPDSIPLATTDLAGSALLVRSVDGSSVFRGAGTLEGFDVSR